MAAPPGSGKSWDAEAIETELRRLVDQFGRWPTAREPRGEGLYSLYCAIRASKCGREGWARRLGVQAQGAGWTMTG